MTLAQVMRCLQNSEVTLFPRKNRQNRLHRTEEMTEIMLVMSPVDLLTINCCAVGLQGLRAASSLKAMPTGLVEGEGLQTSALALQQFWQLPRI